MDSEPWLSGNQILLVAFATGFLVLLLLWSSGSWSEPATNNIYDQQRYNRRLSFLLVSVFALFVAFLGFGMDVFIFHMPVPQLGLNMPDFSQFSSGNSDYWAAVQKTKRMGIPFATIFGAGGAFFFTSFSYENSPRMVLVATQARMANPANPKEAQFINVVKELSIAAGLPVPGTHVVPDGDLNAFATGTGPESSHVAVTEGLLDALNREELQGVVAHELSHIRNCDTELMTMVVALAGSAALLSDWSSRAMRSHRSSFNSGTREVKSDGKGKGGGSIFLVWILFVVFARIISRLMAMAVSRSREYLADASGAELTRNPMSLALALEKIHAAANPTMALSSDSFSHLCIEDPQGSRFSDRSSLLGNLLSTHPPTARRIQALREMAYLSSPQ